MVYTFRKQNLTLPVQGMQLITCYEWVDAVPHGEGVWLTGGVGPMWRDHQLPRDKAASDRARSICHAVLGATIGAQTKRAKLNFLQEPSVWSMQQGGKKIVTEKKVGGPSVVVMFAAAAVPLHLTSWRWPTLEVFTNVQSVWRWDSRQRTLFPLFWIATLLRRGGIPEWKCSILILGKSTWIIAHIWSEIQFMSISCRVIQ